MAMYDMSYRSAPRKSSGTLNMNPTVEREAKPPRRREQLTRPKAPLKTLYNGLHQKGGNEYYIYSSFCFIEIKTLNHRKRDSTSHINIIVR
jgi:hypothetical protein